MNASAVEEVVLRGSAGPRVVGLPVRERNARLARRAGARVVEEPQAGPTLVVPEGVLLDRALFDELAASEAPVALLSPEDPAIRLLWGPADGIAALLAADRGGPADLPTRALPEGAVYDVSTAPARRRAALALLRGTVKPTDGAVSRHLNRPISRFFSSRFLRMGLRPGHASLICLGIGGATAWFLAQPTHLALAVGGVLFQFASIFDGVDGEMARVTLSESEAGARIDTAVDNATYVACLVAFGIGWARGGIGPLDAALIVACVGILLATLLQVFLFVRRYAPDASFVFLDTCVNRAAAATGLPSLRLASGVFRAFRRDLFALVLMFVGFTGSRQAILWLIVASLLFANATMLAHRQRLVEAARNP